MKPIYLKSILAVVFAIQIFVPANIIYQYEKLHSSGTTFRFRCAPIDPIDYLRGKYVRLNFLNETFDLPVSDSSNYLQGNTVYAVFGKDSAGFAKIIQVQKNKPTHTVNYLETTIKYGQEFSNSGRITIHLPFDKYFMEESKAKPAEELYRENIRKDSVNVVALVQIQNGISMLNGLLINEKPIEKVLEEGKIK